jgi:hypothetical protein
VYFVVETSAAAAEGRGDLPQTLCAFVSWLFKTRGLSGSPALPVSFRSRVEQTSDGAHSQFWRLSLCNFIK